MAEGPACGGGPSRAPVLQTGRGLRRAGPRGKHRDPPFFGIGPRNWQEWRSLWHQVGPLS